MTETERLIEERRLENARKIKREWVEKNRAHLNAYNRKWHENFKREHGESYSVYHARKKAAEQLKEEGII